MWRGVRNREGRRGLREMEGWRGREGLGVLLVLGLRQSVVLLRWNQGRVR